MPFKGIQSFEEPSPVNFRRALVKKVIGKRRGFFSASILRRESLCRRGASKQSEGKVEEYVI
jgi:hypothetical protein